VKFSSREKKKRFARGLSIKEGGRVRSADMRLGFVYPDATGGVTVQLCEVEDEHDLDEEAGFRAAVTEGCAALGWTRSEWDFKFPHQDGGQGVMLILCKLRGSTPAVEAFQ
jgi:hypothetical protein